MDNKNAKMLLTGIINNDDEMVNRVITAAFESAMKPRLAAETKNLMESIGNVSKNDNLVGE